MADIYGTSGDDNLTGTADADLIHGAEGHDTLDGGDGDDAVHGDDGNDVLRGGTGSNTLMGWAGNDSLFVAGNDTADGGDGNDLLTVLDVYGTIFDGGTGSDSLTLDFSAAASGATVNLTYLFAGLNGSVNTATVSSFESIAGTIRGSAFNDNVTIGQFYAGATTMQLGAGNDTAVGGNGADTIDGGAGNDNLQGGEGADVLTDLVGGANFSGQGGDDVVLMGALTSGSANGGGGTDRLNFDFSAAVAGVNVYLSDTLEGSVSGLTVVAFESLAGATNLGSAFNDVVGIGAAFTGTVAFDGAGGNDQIMTGAGNDTLTGGSGDDTLGGGGGTNTLTGGIGNDSYVVENLTTTLVEVAGGGTDTVVSYITWALADQFENLTLTGSGNINGYGNGAANVITGNGGANRFEAATGNDTMYGGNGNDTLYGMEGNDAAYGEGGNDTIEDGVGTNTLNGGAGDDFIVFTGDAVNYADGGTGTDLLSITAFNRTTGFVIDFTGMWSGGSGSVNGGTVTGFEGVMGFDGTQWADVINLGAGTSADVGINDAGAGDDTLTGTDGANYINGGAGNDTIAGGGGADDLLGGAGDDAITFSTGTGGTIDGGAGIDTLYIAADDIFGSAALEIDFTELWGGGAGTINGTTVTGIELLQTDWISRSGFNESIDSIVIGAGYNGSVHLSLGNGADSATGGSGDDVISGEQADDVIHGGAGNDSLSGSYASDVVYGDAGDDSISGDTLDVEWGWGNDRLYGGAGNDTIDGGAYQDWLYGGAGNDVLRGDTLALDPSDHGNDLLSGGGGNDQLFGAAGDDTIRGGVGVDELSGDDGVDRLYGDADADTLAGGAGNDVLSGGSGGDTLNGGAGDDTFYVDDAGDMVVEGASGGADVVRSGIDYVLTANVEELFIGGGARDGTGNALDNTLHGSGSANVLSGLGGADVIRGGGARDTLLGGAGADLLDGGVGKDTMTGGADRDVFQFRDGDMGTTRALADVITDFSRTANEKIQLNLIDANTTAGGNQAFTWIGSGAFTGVAGQLHYAQTGGNTYVEGDTNGDGVADFAIALTGIVNLVASDFVL